MWRYSDIGVKPRSAATRAIDTAVDILVAGVRPLVIFPEGGRSPDGWGQEYRGGAAYLSLRCGVPIVPVHLAGTGRVLAKGDKRPKRAATTVTFGNPIIPGDGDDTPVRGGAVPLRGEGFG